jgi:hypothetical protein
MTLCRPLPYLLHAGPLKRGRRHPPKGYDHLLHTRRARHNDVRLARRAFPVNSDPVRPSPPLCLHPRHCSVILSTMGTQVDGTSSRSPLCGLRSFVSRALESAYGRRPSKSSSSTTLEAAPGRAQDPPRHPPEARFTRTTVNSTTLCATLSHAALRAVRHDCKPPLLGL